MKATIVKTAAVAGLFTLMAAATLSAQGPSAMTRPTDVRASTAGEVLGVLLGNRTKKTTPIHKEAKAKAKQAVSEWKQSIDYSGPRFGFTYLPQEIVDSLKGRNINVGTMISQFGWQLEREIHVSPDGPMVLNEWVFLAGGLEKGVFLPSATWLVGARSRTGNEIGFGPNVSIAGVGLALAAGVTVNTGGLHVPMNVAAASSRGGIRVSFLTGFSLH
jgi:hypothetical protein